MRTLPELLGSEDGKRLLETRGVFTSERAFVDRLLPPVRDGLVESLSLDPGGLPVYTAHQVKADYAPSVISKVRAARALQTGHREIAVALLWLDMDRAGSDKSSAALHVRGRGGSLQLRLASRRHDDREVRFVPLERPHLEESMRRLGAWARQHGADAVERHDRLATAFLAQDPRTLADANLALTSFLIREQVGLDAPSALVSSLAGKGMLTHAVNDVVEHIDDVVTVFNGAIDSLIAADVDPQVRHLRPDYLPLHYSCDRDGRRCSLSRQQRGTDTFAQTTCACGTVYRFHLGSGSIDELAATGRWSPDVTLPIYLNDLASGVVAGQSSALYGLVLNEVVEKVLARRPIPMLVPGDLTAVLAAGGSAGLLQDYLTGS